MIRHPCSRRLPLALALDRRAGAAYAAHWRSREGEEMDQAEWLTCADWREMFEFVEGKVTDRKLRLFAVACSRSVWPLLEEQSRRAVEVAERYADELATCEELHSAREMFRAAESDQIVQIIGGRRYRPDLGGASADESAVRAAKTGMRESADLAAKKILGGTGRDYTATEFGRILGAEMACRRRLLHEILGPLPFQPISINPSWQTSNVVAIAKTIYDERRFVDMPILADALEDAGCDNPDILSHLRGPGPHVRGCWVIDLLLGKT